MTYDRVAELKKKTMNELIASRDKFAKFLEEQGDRGHKFHGMSSYLSMIEVEIASRIGTRRK